MSAFRQLFHCVERLYESVLDDASWPRAMRALASFAGATSTFYITADTQAGTIASSECEGLDPRVNEQYVEYYAAKEVRLAPALAVPVGQPMTDETLLDKFSYRRSEIYRDLLVPNDVPHVLAVWTAKKLSTAKVFCFERSHRLGTFDRHDVERCTTIIPHLTRALNTRETLKSMREQRSAYAELLDALSFGALLLDRSLRVLEMSRAARTILDSGLGLAFRAGSIHAISFDDDARLQRALTRAADRGRAGVLPGDSVSVRRADGGSISIVVLPVVAPELFAPLLPAVLLLLFDPAAPSEAAPNAWRKAFGLTEAEARLANVLFAGVTLKEAANRLKLSVNTCKTQLRSIYAKTGCRNHVSLAKCLYMTNVLRNFGAA